MESYDQSLLAETRDVYEIQLQTAWNNLGQNRTFETLDGKSVRILSKGCWNVESGPDFKNARIWMDEQELTGDVEVHFQGADWFRHGHDQDSAYGNVILHVVADAERGANGPDLPTVLLEPQKTNPALAEGQKYKNGRCAVMFAEMDDKDVGRFFMSAGLQRFQNKSTLIEEAMRDEGVERSFLNLVFDAVGYKKNRKAFGCLFERYMAYPVEERMVSREAILWGESGLLPDPAVSLVSEDMTDFVKKRWNDWWRVRAYANEPVEWIKDGVRPLNSPERRIAALCVFLDEFSETPLVKLANHAEKAESPKVFWNELKKRLTLSHPLWDYYSNCFDARSKKANVMGAQRALDLTVNVVLPALHAFAKLSERPELAKFAERVWLVLPKTQMNRTVKMACHRWLSPPSRMKLALTNAAACQGALHLHKVFCETNAMDCGSCPMGNWAR